MIINFTTSTDVKNCTQCPYYWGSIDGPYCQSMINHGVDPYKTLVLPEGREAIHPNCPEMEQDELAHQIAIGAIK